MASTRPGDEEAPPRPSPVGGHRKCRIAVTSWGDQRDDRSTVEVNASFVEGVRRAGGLPLVAPVLASDDASEMIEAFDGVLITGGIDVDPSTYGAERHPAVARVDPARDAFEVALVRAAIEAGRPVLGVCRGAQLMNVACGGTLIQHLPEVSTMAHERREHPERTAHLVRLTPNSVAHGVFGRLEIGVNSLHHQAIEVLGDALDPTGYAEDGTIETVECPPRRLLGVQWHPELMLDHPDGHARLFTWLVDEAGRDIGS